MATRLYFSKVAPNAIFHDLVKGNWDGSFFTSKESPVQWTWRLVSSKASAGAKTNQGLSTNQQGNFDSFFAEWTTYPLEAQTISGTIDLCFLASIVWSDNMVISNDSVARIKIHCYIADGQTRTVKHVLLDNFVDTVDFNYSVAMWKTLSSAQALTAGDTAAGDIVVLEIGIRIVSSPTPAPTYPPSASTDIVFGMIGANSATGDGTNGSTDSSLNSWVEFSHNFSFQALPAAPVNELCANAIAIPSFPYASSFIDASQATGTQKEVFWSFTAPQSGRLVIHNLGSNYGTDISLLASCGGAGAGTLVTGDNALATHRSLTTLVIEVVVSTSYIIRVRNSTSTFNAINGGGVCRLSAFFVENPQTDDLYLPAGLICAIREGQLFNINPDWESFAPTGIAIDYTQRSMDDLNGGTNTSVRLLVGLHNFDLVEIFDINTLNSGQSEVDYIGDPWDLGIPGPAQLFVDSAGMLYAAWFGNGYLYTLGAGANPAFLNTISSNPDFSALKIIDAINGDNQPGAPFSDTLKYPAIEITAAWGITYDEDTGILYYVSGGFYIPVGGQTIKRYNLNTDTQEADFVTIPASGSNPGLKGLTLLSDRSLLVCNGDEVVRVDNAGNIVTTYTPSVALDSRCLVDVKITQDESHFWVVDLWTAHLFKFNLSTGLEVANYETYLKPGTLVQMALYNDEPLPPPPPPPIDVAKITVTKVTDPIDNETEFHFVAEGLDPSEFILKHGESRIFSGLIPGTYSIVELEQAGYLTAYNVSNGDPHTAIEIVGTEHVTVEVTNNAISNSGIYKIQPGKRNDTLWTVLELGLTQDVKIPDPTIRTAKF